MKLQILTVYRKSSKCNMLQLIKVSDSTSTHSIRTLHGCSSMTKILPPIVTVIYAEFVLLNIKMMNMAYELLFYRVRCSTLYKVKSRVVICNENKSIRDLRSAFGGECLLVWRVDV